MGSLEITLKSHEVPEFIERTKGKKFFYEYQGGKDASKKIYCNFKSLNLKITKGISRDEFIKKGNSENGNKSNDEEMVLDEDDHVRQYFLILFRMMERETMEKVKMI